MADSVKLLQNCSHNVRIYWIQFAWADRYAHTNTYMCRLGERWPRACIYNVHRKANEAKHQPLLWLYCIYFYMYCKEAVNLLCLISSNVIYVYVHCVRVCICVYLPLSANKLALSLLYLLVSIRFILLVPFVASYYTSTSHTIWKQTISFIWKHLLFSYICILCVKWVCCLYCNLLPLLNMFLLSVLSLRIVVASFCLFFHHLPHHFMCRPFAEHTCTHA